MKSFADEQLQSYDDYPFLFRVITTGSGFHRNKLFLLCVEVLNSNVISLSMVAFVCSLKSTL